MTLAFHSTPCAPIRRTVIAPAPKERTIIGRSMQGVSCRHTMALWRLANTCIYLGHKNFSIPKLTRNVPICSAPSAANPVPYCLYQLYRIEITSSCDKLPVHANCINSGVLTTTTSNCASLCFKWRPPTSLYLYVPLSSPICALQRITLTC